MILSVRSFLTRAGVGVALFLGAATLAQAQTVTASLRGRVTGGDGSPIASARVAATNTATGVARTSETDAQGWYRILGLQVGPYKVRATAIGRRPVEKTGYELHVGEDIPVDFQLAEAAIEVAGVEIVAEQTPIVDPSQTGTQRRVGTAEIEGLPANGRNFTDFLGLAPTYARTPVFGSGGTIGSMAGSRSSGTIIQIDGAANTGTFFGGDPRGSDRLPIAFSIEAVKEFQVLTNEYDVSKGGFNGGLVNAVTKSGTNELHGSFFEYFRNQALTEVDLLDREPSNFRSHQFGGTVGGPIIRDKAHFFLAFDRQVRTAPFTAAGPATVSASATTFARLDSIIRNVYGVDPGERDQITTKTNEWALFGRVDWALNDQHRVTIRDNLTILDLTGDRIASTDFASNGGPQSPKANSFVVNLFSNVGRNLYNELLLQYATDHKPRPPGARFSQVRVNLGGRFVAFGADSILHYNNLEENTIQIKDNLTYNRGPHAFQAGVEIGSFDFFNLFFNNGRGTYTFNWGSDSANLARMITREASAFTRTIPVDSVTLPTADYTAWTYSAFLQDKWQLNDRLYLNGGVRLDIQRVAGRPRNNPALLDNFAGYFLDTAGVARIRGLAPGATAADSITTGRGVETRYNWAPRLGFTYDLFGDRRTIVRGGAGMFYGYTPFVYWSNMFLNTGRDQLTVVCDATQPATQNVQLNDTDVFDQIAPIGCGPAVAPVMTTFFFSVRDPLTGERKPFRTPRTFKSNIGLEHAVSDRLAFGAEFVYGKTTDNYSIRDLNYRSDIVAVLSGEGGRVVVGTAPGAGGSNARRIDSRFGQILEHDNRSRADYLAVIGTLKWRTSRLDLQAAFSYTRARDDVSISCCTSTTSFRLVEAGINTNNELDGNFNFSDNDRPNTFVLSALWRAPLGLNVNAIWRTFSGLPFTPAISSTADANGDGIRGNDRVYVPRNRSDITIDGNGGGALQGSAFQQDSAFAILDNLINASSCLANQRGRIAARNSCRNDGRSVLDMKLSRSIPTVRGHQLELYLDMFNVLNGIDHLLESLPFGWEYKRWGEATSQRNSLLRIRGFDAANNRYIYEVQRSFGQRDVESAFILFQYQVQLGARYRF